MDTKEAATDSASSTEAELITMFSSLCSWTDTKDAEAAADAAELITMSWSLCSWTDVKEAEAASDSAPTEAALTCFDSSNNAEQLR